MQVVLLERIANLGQMGEQVEVKMGYARNFLLPQKKALRATKENIAYFEKQKAVLEIHNLERKKEAESAAKQMSDVMVTLIRTASESGILYGSIRARDIGEALDKAGYKINRNQIQLIHPIKDLGLHKVRILLHPEVSVDFIVNIAQSEEEAVVQANQEEKNKKVSS